LVRDVFKNLQEFDDFDAFFTELYDLFARAECWRLFEDTVPTLDRLKRRGFRLAVISNWDHRLFSIVEQLGLKEYFETVIASSKIGVAKPGRVIFEAALQAMNSDAKNCLHIGDSFVDDYEGARSVGMQAVLLDRAGKHLNGVTRVRALSELPDVLKA
jgi:putative hydrolase of the HAD superfamily